LQYVKKDCLLIDLASNPGGIDKKAVKEQDLQLVWALALPGKVAPITTAEIIKETIYNILKEMSYNVNIELILDKFVIEMRGNNG